MDQNNGYTQKVQQLEKQNLESFPSDIQKVSPRDQNEILAVLANLPSVNWYSTKLTKDQQDYWFSVRDTYQTFATFLKAKFYGEETPEWYGDKDYLDLFEAWVNYELEFFLLIQQGWKDLKKIQSATGRRNYPDTPRETFSLVLELECLSMFSQCFSSRVEFKPRQAYEYNNIQEKIEENDTEKQPTKSELEFYKRETNRLVKDFTVYLDLRLALLDGCEKLAKTSTSAVYKQRWRSFTQAFRLHKKVQKRLLKKKRGHGWESGHAIETVKAGGTWRRRSS